MSLKQLAFGKKTVQLMETGRNGSRGLVLNIGVYLFISLFFIGKNYP